MIPAPIYVSQVLSEQHPARSNQTKIFLNLIENFPHMRRWSSSSSLINTLAFLRSCIRYWNSNVRPPVAEHQIRLLHRLDCVKAKLLARQIGIPSSSCTPSRGSGCGSSPRPPALRWNFKTANAVLKRISYLRNGARAMDRAADGSVLPLQVY